MLRQFLLALPLTLAPAMGGAQTLTPEELAALVDQRVNALNPYAALLNDPDPQRSLAAMEIMLESGDPTLTRMALEFGLLSPNPTVQRTAVQAYMATLPRLSVQVDGTGVEDNDYFSIMRGRFDGLVNAEGIGIFPLMVGEFNSDESCFIEVGRSNCLVTVNSSGVFISYYAGSSSPNLTASLTVGDSGVLSGTANISGVNEPLPVSIQLID
jgi:hypothetical protein